MPDKRFSSWKEIAEYLGWDERTCLRWEKKHGLPVHRIDPDSKRSRVFAYQDEIDEWLKRRNEGANLRPAGEGDSEKNRPDADDFTGPGAGRAASGGPRKRRGPRPFFIIGGSVFLVGCALAVFFLAIVQADPQPADFQIKGQVLTILDAKGRELWSYDTEREHLKSEAFYREHFQIQRTVDDGPVFPYLIIKDLDGDGKIETLFAAQVVNDVDTGPLLCFDRRGKLKWRFEPGRRMTFGSTEYSNDYWIQLMGLCDLEDDGKLEIVLAADQIPFFPTQVVVLDSSGRVLTEYWNSGRLANWLAADLDGNGLKELVFGGKNNEYKKPCLFVLRPGHKGGGSPQIQEHYRCSRLTEGREAAYILFPQTDIDRLEDMSGDPVEMITLLDNRSLSLWTWHARVNFELRPDMSLVGVNLSDTFRIKYDRYIREGKIRGGDLDEGEMTDKLAGQVLYFDGREWTRTPVLR